MAFKSGSDKKKPLKCCGSFFGGLVSYFGRKNYGGIHLIWSIYGQYRYPEWIFWPGVLLTPSYTYKNVLRFATHLNLVLEHLCHTSFAREDPILEVIIFRSLLFNFVAAISLRWMNFLCVFVDSVFVFLRIRIPWDGIYPPIKLTTIWGICFVPTTLTKQI